MPVSERSVLPVLVSVALAGMLPAMFLPAGYPAAWLLLGTLLALLAAKLRPEPFVDQIAAVRAVRTVVLCFAAYLVLFAGTLVWHGAAVRELDKPVRYVVGGILLLALTRARVEPAVVRALILFAGFCVFGYALFDRIANDAVRVGGFMNEIQFGVLAAQVAMFNVVIVINDYRGDRRLMPFFAAGALAALAACMMSGSLTAILSLAALPLALSLSRRCLPGLRMILLITLLIVATAAAMIHTRAHIAQRSGQALEDVSRFEQARPGATTVSSSGSRLENFRNAWGIFCSSPWIGVGNRGYHEIRVGQVNRGELTAYTGSFSVAHNEYLDAMAKRGLVGLVGLLALLFGPISVFYRLGGPAYTADNPWPAMGMAACIGLAIASLTQNVITHSSGANWLTLTVVLFLALSLRARGTKSVADTAMPPAFKQQHAMNLDDANGPVA